MNCACHYFSVKIILIDEKSLKPHKALLFGLEPHDVLPLGIFTLSKYIGAFDGRGMVGG